ncbi:uncharacterized protein DEA37_0011556 [Paragonimus westermani]|uniref:ENPP1-3/EXOG-like endonuclease/phosphodiesterase domain-containing protein n=1 Tax=Paragonimus westermani TaxID=34504 RepID=A0A5J4NIX1_9TREM|nr:uncharacterized protein DEA37_0011556 [Paragonimus westermani]
MCRRTLRTTLRHKPQRALSIAISVDPAVHCGGGVVWSQLYPNHVTQAAFELVNVQVSQIEGNKKRVSYEVIGPNNVAVPTHFFKAVAIQETINGSWRAVAWVMPNAQLPEKVNLTQFQVPLAAVERAIEGNKKRVSYEVIGPNNVAVPTHFFKAVAIQETINGSWRAVAWVMPNAQLPEKVNLTQFQVPLAAVERASDRPRLLNLIENKIGRTVSGRLKHEQIICGLKLPLIEDDSQHASNGPLLYPCPRSNQPRYQTVESETPSEVPLVNLRHARAARYCLGVFVGYWIGAAPDGQNSEQQ